MPLAGHDLWQSGVIFPWAIISTPMPLAGHDVWYFCFFSYLLKFLLPCPSRGMTLRHIYLFCIPYNFYSHAPRGA